jgi:ABC-2 type transport system ATP-binding protein
MIQTNRKLEQGQQLDGAPRQPAGAAVTAGSRAPTTRRSTSTAIELRDVHRRYGRATALDGLDLVVGTGELFGLIGPNGAGKTTALRVALGLVRPDWGRVRLLGNDPRSAGHGRGLRVGSLVAGPALSPRLTGREHLSLMARWAGAPEVEVDRVIAALGMGRMTERPIGTYSTGMRQILGLGAAFIGPPELLILDEPTTGLDPANRRRVNELLVEQVRAGGTVLVSSHNLDEAERLCSRVGLMSDGRLVLEGPPAELGSAAGRLEVSLDDQDGGLEVLRRAGFVCWGDGPRIVVDTGAVRAGVAGGRGGEVVRALAEAGLYPSEVRRAPTLEIAYTDLIGGFRGRG